MLSPQPPPNQDSFLFLELFTSLDLPSPHLCLLGLSLSDFGTSGFLSTTWL